MEQVSTLFKAAELGPLPPNFQDWEIADADGKSIAHMAAKFGHLPADFGRWEIADAEGRTVAHEAAFYGHLPTDFDKWELADKYNGTTVAHTAAFRGHLPADFDRWEVADAKGRTVAHEAAFYGHLPTGFDKWELADKFGKTVAHIAAFRGSLPADFDRWELANGQGWTVAHEAVQSNHLPAGFNRWDIAGKQGLTVAHRAAFCGNLPADFDRWDIADKQGHTVAHTAAEFGRLPANFDRWELANAKGRTVAHEAAKSGYLPADFNRWDIADKQGRTVAEAIVAHAPKDSPQYAAALAWLDAHKKTSVTGKNRTLADVPILKDALGALKKSSQRLNIDFFEISLSKSKTDNKKWVSPATGDELNVETCVLDYFIKSGWRGYAKEGRVLLDLIKAMSFEEIEPWNAYAYVESFYHHGISPWKFNKQAFTPDELLANVKLATRENISKNLDIMLAKSFRFETANWWTTHSRDESEIVEKSVYIELFDNLGHDLIYNIAKKFREDSYKYRAGWPDITMWKNNEVLFVEVKTTNDRFHTSQKIIINEFAKPLNLKFCLAGVCEV